MTAPPTRPPLPAPAAAPPPGVAPHRRPRRLPPAGEFGRRLWRGRPGDPRWARPALLALLALTAALYLWNLGASGWANAYYSAAVQAGSESWKAFLFGSFDAANSITVDKTPASLWVMELSARLFGVNAWSILVPQALMGVATVGVLYAAVRRRFGPGAGLLAGATLALTPVATLMFRFNNPDALLVLLLTLSGYAVLRAVEDGRTRWLVLAGTCVGFGFLAKMLQAFLVLPALALVYLLCAPTGPLRRVGQLLAGGLALVASAGWWVALVELWPAGSRPYIGGSQHNSILELTLGYNGLGRLNGEETGSTGGAVIFAPGTEATQAPEAPQGGGWGETGIGRLFGSDMGGQIAWLLPAALLLLVAGLWATRRRRRTSPVRAAFLLWGGFLVTHWLVFSYMQGIFHQYYNIALAPSIGAVVAMGATVLWRRRRHPAAAATLAAATALTACWAYVLLGRAEGWHPWLRGVVLVTGLLAALGLLAGAVAGLLSRAGTGEAAPGVGGFAAGRWGRRLALAAGAAALLSALAGPAAFAAQTANTPKTGSIPLAGPATAGAMGGARVFLEGPGPGGGGPGQPGQANPGQAPAGGQAPVGGRAPGGGAQPQGGANGPQGQGGANGGPEPGASGPGQGQGGLLDASEPSAELTAALEEDADSYTWVAAAVGSQVASGYQLATGDPVMPVGGFNGTDPSPTLERFQGLVAAGRIHYFVGDGTDRGMGMMGSGDSEAAQITQWVAENFTATTVDGVTLYDLSGD
ncbi:ArnT family glycosyltransferase [Streptomyces hoynatensis]|uniref:Phospholipid carrier-dependent glycosyltransferase n=1 Tax=Streptomyces hoynatensis TaxID=1141874 RepID=A0A3A9Z0J4_9ACTN|nr:glycosyltransferase family 39 protein [Streptomyces hoynatensis]RKN41670.1 phospholipid carrier-dependent glycosyltransferase [Streptomyces hoynatensis]